MCIIPAYVILRRSWPPRRSVWRESAGAMSRSSFGAACAHPRLRDASRTRKGCLSQHPWVQPAPHLPAGGTGTPLGSRMQRTWARRLRNLAAPRGREHREAAGAAGWVADGCQQPCSGDGLGPAVGSLGRWAGQQARAVGAAAARPRRVSRRRTALPVPLGRCLYRLSASHLQLTSSSASYGCQVFLKSFLISWGEDKKD